MVRVLLTLGAKTRGTVRRSPVVDTQVCSPSPAPLSVGGGDSAAPDGVEGAQTKGGSSKSVLPFERKDCLPVHASPFSIGDLPTNSVLHPGGLESSSPEP